MPLLVLRFRLWKDSGMPFADGPMMIPVLRQPNIHAKTGRLSKRIVDYIGPASMRIITAILPAATKRRTLARASCTMTQASERYGDLGRNEYQNTSGDAQVG